MTAPRYSDTLLEPLVDDPAVHDRVVDLVGPAARRQIWLLPLDGSGVQLPLLIPVDIPSEPPPDAAYRLGRFLDDLAEASGCEAVVLVLERPGRALLDSADRAWLQVWSQGVRSAGVELRGPLLSHDGGVRWVAFEDLGPETPRPRPASSDGAAG